MTIKSLDGFTVDQLKNALIAVRSEADKNMSELIKARKEIKDLTKRFNNFEQDRVEVTTNNHRFSIH